MKPTELRNFRREEFLASCKAEIEKTGLVTNEHRFTPIRDTITTNVKEIERELRLIGYRGGSLVAGQADHKWAETIYYIFDSARLNPEQARSEATAWVNRKFKFD